MRLGKRATIPFLQSEQSESHVISFRGCFGHSRLTSGTHFCVNRASLSTALWPGPRLAGLTDTAAALWRLHGSGLEVAHTDAQGRSYLHHAAAASAARRLPLSLHAVQECGVRIDQKGATPAPRSHFQNSGSLHCEKIGVMMPIAYFQDPGGSGPRGARCCEVRS